MSEDTKPHKINFKHDNKTYVFVELDSVDEALSGFRAMLKVHERKARLLGELIERLEAEKALVEKTRIADGRDPRNGRKLRKDPL